MSCRVDQIMWDDGNTSGLNIGRRHTDFFSWFTGWVCLCETWVQDKCWIWKYITHLSSWVQSNNPCLGHPETGCNTFMMTSSNGNIFRVTGPLCRKFTGHRGIPLTKASDAELWYFLWSAPEQRLSKQSRRRRFETSSRSIWRHCNI